jgi:5-methyltetrahydrofolate--homocysteine methyltransferase
MRETVTTIRRHTAQHGVNIPIVVGGGQLDEQVFRYIGADYWVTDAMSGVRLCQQLSANHRA